MLIKLPIHENKGSEIALYSIKIQLGREHFCLNVPNLTPHEKALFI